jgi:hypothetical protein
MYFITFCIFFSTKTCPYWCTEFVRYQSLELKFIGFGKKRVVLQELRTCLYVDTTTLAHANTSVNKVN